MELSVRNLSYVRFKLKETFPVLYNKESKGDRVPGQSRGLTLSGNKTNGFLPDHPRPPLPLLLLAFSPPFLLSFSSSPSLLSSLPCLPSFLLSLFPLSFLSLEKTHLSHEHPTPADLSGPAAQNQALKCVASQQLSSPGAVILHHGLGFCWQGGQGGAGYPLDATAPTTFAISEGILEAARQVGAAPRSQDSRILAERWLPALLMSAGNVGLPLRFSND